MRFTLRTILAYLDDTLDPAQTRELGHRINKSESAKSLIDRIRTVVRRRRLLAPEASTELATIDANDVAEYVDNIGPGEALAKTERRILESDVHLAEVAVCHQIAALGLTKLPDPSERLESRIEKIVSSAGVAGLKANRRLVRRSHELASETSALEDDSLPVAVAPFAGSKSLKARIGMVATVLALGLLLVFLVHRTVSEPGRPTTMIVGVDAARAQLADANDSINAPKPTVDEDAKPASTPSDDKSSKPAEAKPVAPTKTAAPAEQKSKPEVASKGAPGKPPDAGTPFVRKAAPLPPLPSQEPNVDAAAKSARPDVEKAAATDGADKSKPDSETAKTDTAKPVPVPASGLMTARYTSASGLLFRRSGNAIARLVSAKQSESASETPNAIEDAIRTNDEILLPDGFRATIELSEKAEVELVDRTKIAIPNDTSQLADANLAFTMHVGRIVLRNAEKPLALKISVSGQVYRVSMLAKNSKASLEARVENPGQCVAEALASARLLTLRSDRGEVVVSTEGMPGESRVAAGHELLIRPGSPFESRLVERPLPWVDGSPTSPDAKSNAAFAEEVPLGVDPLPTLRERLTDGNARCRRAAVRAIAAVENVALLVEALKSEHVEVRKLAASSLRAFAGEQSENLDEIRRTLESAFARDEALVLAELIAGYAPADLDSRDGFVKLIGWLDSPQIAIREFAFFNLSEFSARSFNYDASGNEKQRSGPIRSWNNWLESQRTFPPKRVGKQ